MATPATPTPAMPTPVTPVDAVRAAVAAVDAEDWLGAARLCDPASLAAFRRQTLEWVAPTAARPELTVEEYLRHAPAMPREVAEHAVAEHRRQADPATVLEREFADVRTVDALRALAPDETFARWLEGRSHRRQLERLAAEGRISRARLERALAHHVPRLERFAVLGALEDGPRVAHVLYRHEFDDLEAWPRDPDPSFLALPPDEQAFLRDVAVRSHPLVATCRRQPDGGWLVIADHGFIGRNGIVIPADEGDGATG